MKSIIVMSLLVTVVLANDNIGHIKSKLELNGNFFHKMIGDIHNVTKSIFVTILKLSSAETPKFKLYWATHNNLNRMAEKNYEMYIEIKKISKPPVDNTVIKKFFNVSDVVREILFEEIYEHPDIEFNGSNVTLDIENSEEFAEFVKNFGSKIDNLTVNELFKQTANDTDYIIDNFWSRRNLKVWRPSEEIHLNVSRRLYGGTKAKVRNYPFIASVHVMNQLTCAASIISKDLVITAASCLQSLYKNDSLSGNPETVAVRVGSGYASRRGKLIPAVELHFHPSYNPENLYHNLAIIRIERHIRFTSKNRRVRTILLDKNEGKLPSDALNVLALGWGATDKSNIVGLMPKLSASILDIYQLDECKDVYSRYYVTDKHFCAGYLSKGGGACNKDAGGPGVVGGLLTGVLSFGPPACGTVNEPTVFTRIGYYVEWIEEIMEQSREMQSISTTLDHRPSTGRQVTPNIPTRDPLHPIALRNGPKDSTSMESLLHQQILNRVILSENDFQMELRAIPDWAQDLSNKFKPKRTTPNTQPSSTSAPKDILYGPIDTYDIFTTTKRKHLLEHPLINKSMIFIPEVFGINGTTVLTALPTLPWETSPPHVDEATETDLQSDEYLQTTQNEALRTMMHLDRTGSDFFGDNYEDPLK